MKTNFALGLTDDGITLWQRGNGGWLRVGAVATDAADLDAQMQGLANVAAALEPNGMITKLVVPDDQILICDLPVAARNRDMQGHEIRAQLVGYTPYPVEELDLDWTVTDGIAHVAVVARETLIEAEDFASGYGFNPVCAVAAPKAGAFTQELFFGPTRGARDILGDISLLERDGDILQEVGMADLPEPEQIPQTPPAPSDTTSGAAPAPDQPETTGIEEPQATVDSGTPGETAKSQQPEAIQGTQSPRETPPKDEAATGAAPKPEPESDAPETPGPSDGVTPAATPATPQSPASKAKSKSKAKATDASEARKAALLTRLKSAASASSADSGDASGKGATGSDDDPARAKPSTADASQRPSAKADTADTADTADSDVSGSEAPVAFRSRRASASPTVPDTADSKPPFAKPDPGQGLRAKLAGAQNLSRRKIGGLTKAMGAVARGRGAAKAGDVTGVKPQKAAAAASGTKKGAAQSGYPLQISPRAEAAERRNPLETLKDRAGGRTSASPASSEVERMTIFGARNNDLATESGSRRAVLILGGVAMLLLAAGIWAFYFMSRPSAPPEDVAQADLPAEIATPAPVDLPPSEDASLDDPESAILLDEEIEAALGLEDAAQQRPVDATEPEATETVERTDPDPTQLEDVPTAHTEQAVGRVAGMRSSALLPPQDPVPLPDAPANPAPFNADELPPTRSELAQIPPEAEIAPDAPPQDAPVDPVDEEVVDITVTEGTPPVMPPVRPQSVIDTSDAVAEALQQAIPEPASDPVPDEVTQDPTAPQPEAPTPPDASSDGGPAEQVPAPQPDEADLEIGVTQGRPGAVPPQRPDGIAPDVAEPEAQAPASPEDPGTEPSADQAELATPPPGGVALSALRPALRPDALADPALAAPEPEFDASDLAIPASLRPSARPSQFADIVQRALAAAQPATPPVQQARAAAPPIPSSASVAREATQARAINLRRVNLLGVMGTSANRRALVRLSNGRMVTVRVGDSLDNGQVTAISESELRYTRRGRNVVLRIAS